MLIGIGSLKQEVGDNVTSRDSVEPRESLEVETTVEEADTDEYVVVSILYVPEEVETDVSGVDVDKAGLLDEDKEDDGEEVGDVFVVDEVIDGVVLDDKIADEVGVNDEASELAESEGSKATMG